MSLFKKKPMKCAHGSYANCMEGCQMEDGDDAVSRAMKGRRYSEGGKVSNDDKPFAAEFDEPNDFDALTKDDDLDFSETGPDSGDEDGDEKVEEPSHDLVEMVYKKRLQRNPRPA